MVRVVLFGVTVDGGFLVFSGGVGVLLISSYSWGKERASAACDLGFYAMAGRGFAPMGPSSIRKPAAVCPLGAHARSCALASCGGEMRSLCRAYASTRFFAMY